MSALFLLLKWFLLPCRNLMPRTLEGQITMEKTPSYFITKEAPRRVYSMSRRTKLIVVVRDPVTRAVSDYTQTLTKSPGLPSFQNLVFHNSSTGLIDTSWSAVRIGIYAKHLENWLHFFPLSRLLFVSGERLVTDPAGEMGRVQDFLGLKRVVTDKHFYFNQTKGFPCLKKPEGSSRPRCLGKSKGRPHPQIPSEVLLRLRDFYRPFNLKFYQMTGQDFGWDWTATHQSSNRNYTKMYRPQFTFTSFHQPNKQQSHSLESLGESLQAFAASATRAHLTNTHWVLTLKHGNLDPRKTLVATAPTLNSKLPQKMC